MTLCVSKGGNCVDLYALKDYKFNSQNFSTSVRRVYDFFYICYISGDKRGLERSVLAARYDKIRGPTRLGRMLFSILYPNLK